MIENPHQEMQNFLNQTTFAITITDKSGQVLAMNEKAIATFEKYGGAKLIGTSVFDCHPPQAIEVINRLMQTHETNAYTIEKAGQKKLIYQTPWYDNNEFAGYIELSLPLPENIPHKVRS